MNIRNIFKKAAAKLGGVDWKKFVGTKAFITVGALVLVCAIVLIGSIASTKRGTEVGGTGEGTKVLGNALLVDTETRASAEPDGETSLSAPAQDVASEGDFFAMAIINRTQVRDSALEVLRTIADSPDAMPDQKESALISIAAIADEMSAEANIETLIRAKGISDCVAVISGKTCSVIVNSAGLVPEELTQITDIVYEQAGIPVENITVVEAKKQ